MWAMRLPSYQAIRKLASGEGVGIETAMFIFGGDASGALTTQGPYEDILINFDKLCVKIYKTSKFLYFNIIRIYH